MASISELCWNQPRLAVIGEEIHNYTESIQPGYTWATYGEKAYALLNNIFPNGQPHDTMNAMLSVLEYAGVTCTLDQNGTLSSCDY